MKKSSAKPQVKLMLKEINSDALLSSGLLTNTVYSMFTVNSLIVFRNQRDLMSQ